MLHATHHHQIWRCHMQWQEVLCLNGTQSSTSINKLLDLHFGITEFNQITTLTSFLKVSTKFLNGELLKEKVSFAMGKFL